MLHGVDGVVKLVGTIVMVMVCCLLPVQRRVSLPFRMLPKRTLLADSHGLPEHDGKE